MKFNEAYEFDNRKTEEGVWRTLPSGLKVKVASVRSPKYATAIMRLKRTYAETLNIKDKDTINLITCKAMAQAILLDWEGAEDENGKDVPYSTEAAEEYLSRYEVFREEVSAVAAGDDNYRPEDIGKKLESE